MELINISSFGDDNTVKLSAQNLALKMFAFLSLWVSKLIQMVQGKVGLHVGYLKTLKKPLSFSGRQSSVQA